jgi:hypothetical protein
MKTPNTTSPRWYRRTGFWLAVLAVELIGGWLYLNAQVIRGFTPESAAAAGIAFLSPETSFGDVRWERTSEESGGNFGRRIHLVAHRGPVQIATATVNSFLGLGWQLRDYTTDEFPEAVTPDSQ